MLANLPRVTRRQEFQPCLPDANRTLPRSPAMTMKGDWSYLIASKPLPKSVDLRRTSNVRVSCATSVPTRHSLGSPSVATNRATIRNSRQRSSTSIRQHGRPPNAAQPCSPAAAVQMKSTVWLSVRDGLPLMTLPTAVPYCLRPGVRHFQPVSVAHPNHAVPAPISYLLRPTSAFANGIQTSSGHRPRPALIR